MNSVVTDINDCSIADSHGAGPPVSIRDVGSVSDAPTFPPPTLVNGRRAVISQ